MSFRLSDKNALDFSLTQKENEPAKLYLTKHKDDPHHNELFLYGLFWGKETSIEIQDHLKIIEYVMPFEEPYPTSENEKPLTYGNPDKPQTLLEDTEHCFHFNRLRQKIELSHLIKGKVTRSLDHILNTTSSIMNRKNIKAYIHASWTYEESVMADLMPHIGSHIDTYTPIRGFDKTEDIDIKGPFDGGAFIKKVRHTGPFYHRTIQKNPINESLVLNVNYNADTTKELLFYIPDGYGPSFLDTDDGAAWISHIKRMVHRIDLLQSRTKIVTVTVPAPVCMDITLDDEIEGIGKVIAYTITPHVTVITCACFATQSEIKESAIKRELQSKEWNINVSVTNDAAMQEEFMNNTPIIKIDQLPKTQINVSVG